MLKRRHSVICHAIRTDNRTCLSAAMATLVCLAIGLLLLGCGSGSATRNAAGRAGSTVTSTAAPAAARSVTSTQPLSAAAVAARLCHAFTPKMASEALGTSPDNVGAREESQLLSTPLAKIACRYEEPEEESHFPYVEISVSQAPASVFTKVERLYTKAHISYKVVPAVGEHAVFLATSGVPWPTDSLAFVQHGYLVDLFVYSPSFDIRRGASVAAALSAEIP